MPQCQVAKLQVRRIDPHGDLERRGLGRGAGDSQAQRFGMGLGVLVLAERRHFAHDVRASARPKHRDRGGRNRQQRHPARGGARRRLGHVHPIGRVGAAVLDADRDGHRSALYELDVATQLAAVDEGRESGPMGVVGRRDRYHFALSVDPAEQGPVLVAPTGLRAIAGEPAFARAARERPATFEGVAIPNPQHAIARGRSDAGTIRCDGERARRIRGGSRLSNRTVAADVPKAEHPIRGGRDDPLIAHGQRDHAGRQLFAHALEQLALRR